MRVKSGKVNELVATLAPFVDESSATTFYVLIDRHESTVEHKPPTHQAMRLAALIHNTAKMNIFVCKSTRSTFHLQKLDIELQQGS